MILKKHVAALRVDLGAIPAVTARTSSSSRSESPRPGYIVARNYPGEAQGLHVRPDLQTWAANPYDAPYTQVVQKAGGSRGAHRAADRRAGPQHEVRRGLQQGRHLPFPVAPAVTRLRPRRVLRKAPLAHRPAPDVWYVPMGPAYAFHTIVESDRGQADEQGGAKAAVRGLERARPQDLQRQPHARVRRAGIRHAFWRMARSSRSGRRPSRIAGTRSTSDAKASALFVTVHVQHHAGVPMTRQLALCAGARAAPGQRRGGSRRQADVAGAWNMTYTTREGVKMAST